MTENMRKLLEKLSEDKALAEKLSKLETADLIAAAKELGIELTGADFDHAEEVSDDELNAVAGGALQNCWCVAGGGGKADPEDGAAPCACVLAGYGDRGCSAGDAYCACVAAGNGADTD